jgi:hypothetical protein
MSPYIPDLDQVQLGTESTFGTAVTPTVKLGLVDKITIIPNVKIDTLPDKRGSLQPGYVDVIALHDGKAKITGAATYQDLPYWLDSIFGIATPTGPTNFVRSYTGPTSAAQTRRMMTLVKGQTGAVAKLTSGIVDTLTLSCDKNGVMQYEASMIGKQVSDGTLAVLSDRVLDPIRGSDFSIAVDTWAGTIGATLLTGLIWYSWNLAIKSNVNNQPGLGSIYPVKTREAAWSVVLKVKMELEATAAALITAYLSAVVTQRQIRIKATTGVSAVAQFDVAGTYKKIGDLHTDTDGVVSVEFEIDGLYNPTLGNSIAASVTNQVAAMA